MWTGIETLPYFCEYRGWTRIVYIISRTSSTTSLTEHWNLLEKNKYSFSYYEDISAINLYTSITSYLLVIYYKLELIGFHFSEGIWKIHLTQLARFYFLSCDLEIWWQGLIFWRGGVECCRDYLATSQEKQQQVAFVYTESFFTIHLLWLGYVG